MSEEATDEIKILAKGPMMTAHKYSSYTINGLNFHTKSYDEGRAVQNSGVVVVAESASFERGNNDQIIIGKNVYYGVIKKILELNYQHKGNVVLFMCDWVDNRVQDKWVKTDQFGATSVNFKHLFNTGEKISDEPFILASQALQVYYIPDQVMPSVTDLSGTVTVDIINGVIPSVRTDIDGVIVDKKSKKGSRKRKNGKR